MSNRKDVTKIILPEMNKTSVPAVPILNSQEEMDIAKKKSYCFPKYGTGNTYIKITRAVECLLKTQIVSSIPDPWDWSFFG